MTINIDDNLQQSEDGTVTCRHCAQHLGTADSPLRDARVTHSAPGTAGPSVRENSELFTDRPVTLRRTFCPNCLTLLQAEIVPADEPSARHRSLAVRP
jgi:N-methylhydantoinase B